MIADKSDTLDALNSLLANNPRLAKRARERQGLAEVASLLLQLRQVTGLTQAELAQRSGVTKTLISELENAANDGVTLRTLARIARGAGASLEIKFSLGKAECTPVCTELHCGNDLRLNTPIRVSTRELTGGVNPLAA
jgi:transcriptional regulator with XRE-family HTH domain